MSETKCPVCTELVHPYYYKRHNKCCSERCELHIEVQELEQQNAELKAEVQGCRDVAEMTANELCGQPDTKIWDWTIKRLRLIQGKEQKHE